MMKPVRRLISSGVLLVLIGGMVLAAKKWNALVFSFYPKFSRTALGYLAGVSSVLPIAIWEVLVCILAITLIVTLIICLAKHRFLRWLTGVLLTVSIGCFFFITVWGLNYFAPPMQERLGLQVRQYTVSELREATEYYLAQANEAALAVPRDANGVTVAADFSELSEAAGAAYRTLAQSMPCFDGSDVGVKKLLSSKLFGATGTTGIFIAFTGESCVSTTTFSASVPFTMCHEVAHRMAFARENEANFAAFLACTENTRADFRYSGYYSAFIYCYNALHRADPDTAAEVWAQVSEPLKTDFAASRAHYDELENEAVCAVSEKVYDTYLKAFSVESGSQSYGEVVDLLAAWYFERLK